MISPADMIWRRRWIATIRARAHELSHVLALQFRAAPATPAERVELAAVVTQPRPPVFGVAQMIANLPLDIGEMKTFPLLAAIDVKKTSTPRLLRRLPVTTGQLPFVTLVPLRIVSTDDMLTAAVQWFAENHQGIPPDHVWVSPLRFLRNPVDFYPVPSCESLGLFTVALNCDKLLSEDTLRLQNTFLHMEERVLSICDSYGKLEIRRISNLPV